MRKMFAVALLAAATLTFLAAAGAARASWRSSYLMAPNQGYCKDGHQHADVSRCPENRKRGAARNRKRPQQAPLGHVDPDG